MEDYNKDAEGRREYGREGERQYSSEGRVLRPRKKVGSSAQPQRNYGEHRGYNGPRKDYNGPRREYGEGRPYDRGEGYRHGGEGRSYDNRGGEGRPYGGRSNFSGNGERGGYNGPRREYNGPRREYGEGRPYDKGEGYRRGGEGRPYDSRGGEGRPYGGRSNFSGNGERGGYNGPRKDFNAPRKDFNGPRNFGEGRAPYKAGGKGNFQKGRKPFRKEEAFKDDSGIDRMLESRPQVEKLQYSDFDSAPVPVKDEIRLNKFIANSGVCSRREADTFIQAGVVTVNGEVVTELGTKVNVNTDDVRFNGERLKGEEKVYVVMNKPKGFVTTASDPHAEKTVMDLLKGCKGRVFPVGRLDKATTGVLMFTNDGEIAERLTHPSYDKKKIYQVLLDHPLEQADYDRILSGIELSDGEIRADELEYIDEHDHRKLGIEIHSGKNRIVRRIFESLGYDVRALDRVYFAGLTKKGLQKGEWRYLSQGEVNILKMGAYV